ncbi:hypothetical protein F4861DRAFT_531031 [Xylaria intraflava]|nr:hypothetical protein F4861DRAFT_531031 [Xylaria intraflava]
MAPGDLQCHQHTRGPSQLPPVVPGLRVLLSNTLVLYQTIPYLPFPAIVNLAATSHSFHALLHGTPGVFRHLDLTQTKLRTTQQSNDARPNTRNDEVTEDEVYSSPLRHIFSSLRRYNILGDVNTLVLDGLSVTAEFINDILVDPSLRIHILSIRDVKNLNERKLMQALRYACRPTRPEDTPRLKGLYYFGEKNDAPPAAASLSPQAALVVASRGANISVVWNQKSRHALKSTTGEREVEDWYSQRGRMINKHIDDGWAETLLDCREMLRFDAVLCTGPRHQNSSAFGKVPITPVPAHGCRPWGVATYAVGGCAACGSAPEGFTVYGDAHPSELPLLSPIPLHSSTVKSATRPRAMVSESNQRHEFVPRCAECISERYCHSCNRWWCESCYQVPHPREVVAQHVHINDNANEPADLGSTAFEQLKVKAPRITRSCWECEHNCLDCIAETQKRCQGCGGGYCIIHYEGSTLTLCDWCSRRPIRRCRELY